MPMITSKRLPTWWDFSVLALICKDAFNQLYCIHYCYYVLVLGVLLIMFCLLTEIRLWIITTACCLSKLMELWSWLFQLKNILWSLAFCMLCFVSQVHLMYRTVILLQFKRNLTGLSKSVVFVMHFSITQFHKDDIQQAS